MYLVKTETIEEIVIGRQTIKTSKEYTRPLEDNETCILDLLEYIGNLYEGDLCDCGFGCEYDDFTDFYIMNFDDRSIERTRDYIISLSYDDDTTNSKIKELDELWEKSKSSIEKLKQEGWERFII